MTSSQCENILWVCFDGLGSPAHNYLQLRSDNICCPVRRLQSRRQMGINRSGRVQHAAGAALTFFGRFFGFFFSPLHSESLALSAAD